METYFFLNAEGAQKRKITEIIKKRTRFVFVRVVCNDNRVFLNM